VPTAPVNPVQSSPGGSRPALLPRLRAPLVALLTSAALGLFFSLPYFAVEHLPGALAEVEVLGGSVVHPGRVVGDLQGLGGQPVRVGGLHGSSRSRHEGLCPSAKIPVRAPRMLARSSRPVAAASLTAA